MLNVKVWDSYFRFRSCVSAKSEEVIVAWHNDDCLVWFEPVRDGSARYCLPCLGCVLGLFLCLFLLLLFSLFVLLLFSLFVLLLFSLFVLLLLFSLFVLLVTVFRVSGCVLGLFLCFCCSSSLCLWRFYSLCLCCSSSLSLCCFFSLCLCCSSSLCFCCSSSLCAASLPFV